MEMTNGNVFAVDKGYTNTRKKKDGLICLNDTALLKTDSIDCLIMMDVLEHIENENAFLQQVLETLTPGGKIIITVPAFQFVFSSHDLFLKHYRRYNRKNLVGLLRKNGIIIEQAYYFYSSLFLLRWLFILLEKTGWIKNKNAGIGLWSHAEDSFMTKSLWGLLNIDFSINQLLNKIHIRLPGLSLIAVCRKKK